MYLLSSRQGVFISEQGKHEPAKLSSLSPANSANLTRATELGISSPWTRSPGRVRFRTLLQAAIARSQSQLGYGFAVIYADLDRFNLVNDSLGRDAGDRLLMEVSRRLRACLRPDDVLTRLREDEYLIFLDNIDGSAKALELAARFGKALREPFQLDGQQLFVSASAGIALSLADYSGPEQIVRDAEAAMHYAKNKGPGSYELYDRQIQEQARLLLKLETELRAAIELQQFRMQYEPIVHLDTGEVAGFESLIRWQHPERGLIYPGQFLQCAEDTGLIIPITRWTLRHACMQLQQWQARHPDFASLWLTINLSPSYVQKCNFAEDIAQAVAESGVASANLVVELTENQLLDNAEPILEGFARLHDLGVKLWIDDFGAGYSSLGYLVKFPIHCFKIDRSFVMNLPQDKKSAVIANAILSLGKSLGVNVVAEGIETVDQLEFLRSAGCPDGQGYFFSSSVDAQTIDGLFESRRRV